jgi:hypothetical protein
MVGWTAMPLKQEQDQSSQGQQSGGGGGNGGGGGGGGGEQGDWNHNQPKGKAAEAIMMYLGGSRSHPIAMVDDRRVRPYQLKEGEAAFYAASGTGQMVFHNDDGSYLLVTNNPPEQSQDNQQKERYASVRHVAKDKQPREISQSQQGGQSGGQSGQQQDPQHQGKTVNTEVRCTSSQVQILDGSTVVGVYDKSSGTWTFTSKNITLTVDQHLILKYNNGPTYTCAQPINFNSGGPTTPPFTDPG